MNKLVLQFLLLFAILLFVSNVDAQANWPYGDKGTGLAVMENGTVLIGGEIRSREEQAPDLMVIALDNCGNPASYRRFGDAQQDGALSLLPTRDGGVLAVGYTYFPEFGRGRHDYYMLKFDANLRLEWEQLWGGVLRDMAYRALELDNGFLVAGYTRSSGSLGQFGLIMIDRDGQLQWAQNYGDAYTDYARDLALTSTGLVVLGTAGGIDSPTQSNHHNQDADILLIETDPNGVEIGRRYLGGNRHDFGERLLSVDGGGYYLLGSSQSSGAGSFDMLLARLDASLDTLWTRTYGGTDFEYGQDMARDNEGNLYLAGTSASRANHLPQPVVIKVDPSGDVIWQTEIESQFPAYGQAIASHPAGGFVLTGHQEKNDGNTELLVARLWEDGQLGFLRYEALEPTLFPNPVVGTSEIDPGTGVACQPFTWEVYDSGGRLILKRVSDGQSRMEVRKEEFPAGIYIYKVVTDDEQVGTGKFIVH